MQTIIIVIHLLVVLALVGVVLMQRSEGGGLGIGGGSGFMTARGAANALTRTTAILAAAFFVTSLALSLIARYQNPTDIFDRLPQTEQNGEGGGAGILDQLGGGSTPSVPAPAETPVAPAEQPDAPAPADAVPSGDQGSGAQAPTETAPAETTPTPAEEQSDSAPAGDQSTPAPAEPEAQVPTGQ